MPIGSAVQKGSTVYVYDERGRTLFTKSGGTKPTDGLQGFTGLTVSIRIGSTMYTLMFVVNVIGRDGTVSAKAAKLTGIWLLRSAEGRAVETTVCRL